MLLPLLLLPFPPQQNHCCLLQEDRVYLQTLPAKGITGLHSVSCVSKKIIHHLPADQAVQAALQSSDLMHFSVLELFVLLCLT